MPKRNKQKEFIFTDYPEFKPNLSPREIFLLGSFGGTYWRPIYSSVVNKKLSNVHKKYPKSWWKNIPDNKLTTEWKNYDKNINKYKVKVGTTLEYWESQNWITKYNPYGWVHWYCDFFQGKRTEDDERQIQRWLNLAGPNGRFRKRLVNMIKHRNPSTPIEKISPKIRQTLQHWAFVL